MQIMQDATATSAFFFDAQALRAPAQTVAVSPYPQEQAQVVRVVEAASAQATATGGLAQGGRSRGLNL